MRGIRRLVAQRHVATLICAAALLLKLLVPTGYMIGSDHGRTAITICTGMTPATVMPDMPGMQWAMLSFWQKKSPPKLASVHANVYNHFSP